MSRARARFDPTEEAMKALSKLSADQLRNLTSADARVRQLKLSPQAFGKIRKRLLASKEPTESNGDSNGNGMDLLARMTVVMRAARRVGGLPQLEATTQIIRKAKEL